MILTVFTSSEVLLPLLVGIVAFLYAGVGHGGASGYIAVMILLGMMPSVIRPQALVLNCMVSLLSFFAFRRIAGLDLKVFLPLSIASIPASFLGGTITLPDNTFHLLLGILLLIPVVRLLEFSGSKPQPKNEKQPTTAALLLTGAGIGLLSGIIGIGGGILLSPLFLMLGWSTPKKVAALSAIFIFVNSLSGLSAQVMVHGPALFSDVSFTLVLSALSGGVLGARVGSDMLTSIQLKRLLATVILFASVKLIFT